MKLYIDKEAVDTLLMLKNKLLLPVDKLMNKKEAELVDKTKTYKNQMFPFSFILAPSGKKNEEVLKKAKRNQKLTLITEDNKECGYIIVEDIFTIDKDKRIRDIYGTNNPEHPGVKDTYKRLGKYAISGEFKIYHDTIINHKQVLNEMIKKTNSKKIAAMMISAKPFHRVHERLLRTALVRNDLVVLFILKPYIEDFLSFDIRYKTLKFFIDKYIPKNRVLIIPLESTYIFGGFNELILNSIVAKNFGCTSLVIGKNHAGIGAYYENNRFNSIIDEIDGIEIDVMSEFVYCNECKTLVSTDACPHGRHHHLKYDSKSILKMLKLGIIPPTILVRKEISAILLSSLNPTKYNDLKYIYQNLYPNSGLLNEFEIESFYEKLIELYQTSSLT